MLYSLVIIMSMLLFQVMSDLAPEYIECVNDTHYAQYSHSEENALSIQPCPQYTACKHNVCQGELAMHMAKSTFMQQAALYSPPSELSNCSADPEDDAHHARVLCDVFHATKEIQPGVLHELGNTWLSRDPSQSGPCGVNASTWRSCLSANLKIISDKLRTVSPASLFSGGLMEYLYQDNLDNATEFIDACIPGSIGQWGNNKTCIPNIAGSPQAREYYIHMGMAFLDAGCTLLFFGQARLTGGGVGDVSSAVSPAGALGFQHVITAIRSYASSQGYGPIYFGAQAACCIKPSGGDDLIDFVYGAQHLQPVAHAPYPMLIQPLSRQSPAFLKPQSSPPWPWLYGNGDWHDANLINNENGKLVVLDFDNWSGSPSIPDDIRTLACLPDNIRAQAVSNLYHHLSNYNPRASVSIPLSKCLAGTTCPNIGNIQCAGNLSFPGGVYFSANACNIITMAKELFSKNYTQWPYSPTAPFNTTNPPIERHYWGQQLRSPDATVSWLYRAILGRTVDVGGYTSKLATLPQVPKPGNSQKTVADNINSAVGPRMDLAVTLLTSSEFHSTYCNNTINTKYDIACATQIVTSLYRSLLLYDANNITITTLAKELVAGTQNITGLALTVSAEADEEKLYSAP
eukprot:m.19163 g.19163  ORF g.19163 m.19163 type:complete len:630 (-) comp6501_c0_seq1:41-1930(-)